MTPAPTITPASSATTASPASAGQRAVGQAAAPLGGEVGHGGADGSRVALPARAVTALDWIIVAFTVLMAVWGYAQGLIVGALSLAGFAAGAFSARASGRWCSRRARPRPTRRCSRWSARPDGRRHARLRPGGARLPAAPPAGRRGSACSTASAAALLVACLGLGLVWIGGAVALQTPGARELREPIQRSKILRVLNEHLPPSGPILQRARALRPVPADRRARRPTCGRPTRGSPATRRCARPGAAWSRCSAPPAGSASRAAAGSPATAWSSRTPTSWPARTTRPCRSAARARGSTPRRSGSTRATTSRSCASPGLGGGRRCGCDEDAGAGHLGGDPRLPRERPLRRARRRGSGSTSTVVTPGRLRPRAGAPLDHVAARARAPGQLGRARGRRRGAGWSTTIFAATVSDGGRSGYGVPDSVVADALDGARGPVDTGPVR